VALAIARPIATQIMIAVLGLQKLVGSESLQDEDQSESSVAPCRPRASRL
jgi:hypothetical protein